MSATHSEEKATLRGFFCERTVFTLIYYSDIIFKN